MDKTSQSRSERAHLGRLRRNSETILREIDAFDEENRRSGTNLEEQWNDDEKHRFAQVMARQRQLMQNGYADIRVSPDEMEVHADFFPPAPGCEPIEVEAVFEQLEAEGVIYGMKEKVIRDSVFRCNTERREVRDVVVAAGRPAVHAIPAYYRTVDRGENTEPTEEGGRIDHRAISPFTLVKKDDVLAERVEPVEGTMGMTVCGRAVPFGRSTVGRVEAGDNTYTDDAGIRASTDGRVVIRAGVLCVNKILTVGGDVDYSTGHIDFPGDVVVAGEVRRGFNVRSVGSLYCAQGIDASNIDVGGALQVARGIIGRGDGNVRVAKDVAAKFIESCYLHAGGNVSVRVGILNSWIFSNEMVATAPGGVICGGRVTARDGVVAGQLGNRANLDTEIVCGVDYKVQQKLEWLRDKNVEIASQLRKLRSLHGGAGSHSAAEQKLESSLKAALEKINAASQRLVFELDKNDAATVRCTGVVYPGVVVEILHVRYAVVRQLKGVVFRLDKAQGTIAVQYERA